MKEKQTQPVDLNLNTGKCFGSPPGLLVVPGTERGSWGSGNYRVAVGAGQGRKHDAEQRTAAVMEGPGRRGSGLWYDFSQLGGAGEL